MLSDLYVSLPEWNREFPLAIFQQSLALGVSRYQLNKSYGILNLLLSASRWIKRSLHNSWAGENPESGWSAIASEPWETNDNVSSMDPVQIPQACCPSNVRKGAMLFRLEPLHGHVQCGLLVRRGFTEFSAHRTSVPFTVPSITSSEFC